MINKNGITNLDPTSSRSKDHKSKLYTHEDELTAPWLTTISTRIGKPPFQS